MRACLSLAATQSCVVAIVVPSAEHLKTYAAEHHLPGTTLAEWVTQDVVQKAVEADMLRVAKEAKVRTVGHLDLVLFSVF